jgi:hypothetical protein
MNEDDLMNVDNDPKETANDLGPSWWNKPIPESITYREMVRTPAAPDVLYQHTDSMSRFMMFAQMALMWMMENGSLTDTEVEKEEKEKLFKSQHMFHQQFEARSNELGNMMSQNNQRPNAPTTKGSEKREESGPALKKKK